MDKAVASRSLCHLHGANEIAQKSQRIALRSCFLLALYTQVGGVGECVLSSVQGIVVEVSSRHARHVVDKKYRTDGEYCT